MRALVSSWSAGAPAGTVASREAGSRLQFTIAVDDVDAACAELAARGISLLNGPVNRPWGIRTASFTDPGGHDGEVLPEECRWRAR